MQQQIKYAIQVVNISLDIEETQFNFVIGLNESLKTQLREKA